MSIHSTFKVKAMTKKQLAAWYDISVRTLSRMIKLQNEKRVKEKVEEIDYSCSPLSPKVVQQIVDAIGEP